MFLKVMEFDSGHISWYECDRIFYNRDELPSQEIRNRDVFHVESNNAGCISMQIGGDGKKRDVFLLNNDGKTIDHIVIEKDQTIFGVA